MSILVKDWEMPNGCNKCDLLEFIDDSDDTNCLISTNDWSGCVPDYRPKNCPLIKIPTPHGRLIDADRLIKILQDTLDNYPDNDNDGKVVEKLVVTVCKRFIEKAPTVIESELEPEKDESLKRKELVEAIRAIGQRFKDKQEVSE